MVALGESPQPLYLRVYRLIADEIASGSLGPGDRLPSERDLTERLGVSRATVRRALGELANDGLVEASAGRGSFVATGPLVEPPNALLSFTELGGRHGLQATARVLRLEAGPRPSRRPSCSASRRAPISWSSSGCACSTRCRSRSTSPGSRSRGCRGRSTTDFSTASLYDALEQSGHPPVRAAYTVEALPAPEREGALLGIRGGEPVLVAETTAYDPNDRLVELARTHYRADRYRFRATLVRRR